MNDKRNILLVDDSRDNLTLMRAAFEMAGCDNPLQEVCNGEEAIAYLKGEAPYADRNQCPLPAVMLLDLNMPRINGFEVLAWVRAQPVLKRLSIVIITASTRQEDLERAFDLGATAFLVKPGSLDRLADMMRRLCDWMQMTEFPALDEAGRYDSQAIIDARHSILKAS